MKTSIACKESILCFYILLSSVVMGLNYGIKPHIPFLDVVYDLPSSYHSKTPIQKPQKSYYHHETTTNKSKSIKSYQDLSGSSDKAITNKPQNSYNPVTPSVLVYKPNPTKPHKKPSKSNYHEKPTTYKRPPRRPHDYQHKPLKSNFHKTPSGSRQLPTRPIKKSSKSNYHKRPEKPTTYKQPPRRPHDYQHSKPLKSNFHKTPSGYRQLPTRPIKKPAKSNYHRRSPIYKQPSYNPHNFHYKIPAHSPPKSHFHMIPLTKSYHKSSHYYPREPYYHPFGRSYDSPSMDTTAEPPTEPPIEPHIESSYKPYSPSDPHELAYNIFESQENPLEPYPDKSYNQPQETHYESPPSMDTTTEPPTEPIIEPHIESSYKPFSPSDPHELAYNLFESQENPLEPYPDKSYSPPQETHYESTPSMDTTTEPPTEPITEPHIESSHKPFSPSDPHELTYNLSESQDKPSEPYPDQSYNQPQETHYESPPSMDTTAGPPTEAITKPPIEPHIGSSYKPFRPSDHTYPYHPSESQDDPSEPYPDESYYQSQETHYEAPPSLVGNQRLKLISLTHLLLLNIKEY
jgi:hypothetical protein